MVTSPGRRLRPRRMRVVSVTTVTVPVSPDRAGTGVDLSAGRRYPELWAILQPGRPAPAPCRLSRYDPARSAACYDVVMPRLARGRCPHDRRRYDDGID